jgi:DNA polymerase III sliding clamp (beta) subunit (PCNA family)
MTEKAAPVKFTARRHVLAAMAEWAMIAVPSSFSAPANGCFQLTAADGRLLCAAADHQLAVFFTTSVVDIASEGAVFVSAKRLKALLGEAQDGDVTLSVEGVHAVVTAGPASWKIRLPSTERGHSGFPDLSGAQYQPTEREPLHAALSSVRHAMGRDSGRQAFMQVRIQEAAGKTYAYAADSNQMARCQLPGFPGEVSVPGPVLDDLLKLLGKTADDKVEVAETGTHVVFRAGPVTMAALKSSQEFPPVEEQFVDKTAGNDMRLAVTRAELQRALRRVRVAADAATSAIGLELAAGKLTVSSNDGLDSNSAREELAATWAGPDMVVVVNAEQLAAALSSYPGATCEFWLGKSQGQQQARLKLQDDEAGVLFVCSPLAPKTLGYR